MSTAEQEQVDLTLLAKTAIQRKKTYDQAKTDLEETKESLRGNVPEFPHKIDVSGLGSVQVKSPPEKKTKTVIMFDEKKWNDLPESFQNSLLESGLVYYDTKTTGGGVPSVEIKPNV